MTGQPRGAADALGRDYSYRSPAQQAHYHENIHPGGDVIPMHQCEEPSCVQATTEADAHYPARAVHRDMARRNISGRDQPHPSAEPVTHNLRFWGNLSAPRDLFAECAPCDWSAWVDGGHTGPELMDLIRQHAGVRP